MGTLSPHNASTALQRIAELARERPGQVFTSIHHVIDLALLLEACRRTRKDGAVGVDKQTAEEYGADLEKNLGSLCDRLKLGTYYAPPVRRVHIPKGDGTKTRPIGIPTYEDKVLQRAVAMVLEAIYEQDFLDCSYGFRPGRSAHQALEVIFQGMMQMRGGYVIELDIEKFFDRLDHKWLRSFLDQRVRDGVMRRVIHKWLKAGVMEDGQLTCPKGGTPQGGVISPLLANIYLHEVLDRWFTEEVAPRLAGKAFLVRFADDAVMVFSCEEDARRVLEVLPKRFTRFGLTLHPEKTRLVQFRCPPYLQESRTPPQEGGPGSFDFLGFTHYWAKSRKGRWVVRKKTARDRLRRSLNTMTQWCRRYRHHKVAWQHEHLVRKIRGHYGYYGLTGNDLQLKGFLEGVKRIWHYWLSRRSESTPMPWDRFNRLLARYPLPPVRIVHSVYRCVANP
jgi:group II intron reverse transcriptase/maturase